MLSDQGVVLLGRRLGVLQAHKRQADALVVQSRRIATAVSQGEDGLGVLMGQVIQVPRRRGPRVIDLLARRARQGSFRDAARIELLVGMDDPVAARAAGQLDQESGVSVEQPFMDAAVVVDDVALAHVVSY
ncbi:hypothetical protein ACFCY8_38595 [Streptomyces noursei]|uniref:hypothetical protein n=1 Tax=Streptomyces noursei TaxID=1971 RepID=UPI0035DA08EF